MKDIGIGLLGFGTVGAGVVEGLRRNGAMIAERAGATPILRRIVDIDLESDRGVEVDRSILTSDANAVLTAPDIDIVIELIGGTGIAKDIVLQALAQGKPVVTANKALLADHGAEIFALAAEKNVDIYFGASVGGGIPIIRALRDGLLANRIESIKGILNGTCNYILTRMENEGLPFDQVLAQAQAAGYAEADPGLDIDGWDTAHKAAILASLAYGFNVPMAAIHVEGIRDIQHVDLRCAQELGYRIKLLAVIKQGAEGCAAEADSDADAAGNEIEVRVHPTLIGVEHVLASVSGVFNAVMVEGDLTGPTLYYGRGAGQAPTASTVLADVVDVARNLVSGCPRRTPAIPGSSKPLPIRSIRHIASRYYMRLSLLDQPGVLAQIAAALGAHGISIASALQKEPGTGRYVPVVLVTHRACEENVEQALHDIDAMNIVGTQTVRFRIED